MVIEKILIVLLASAPAWAQSKRYPPEPKDPDREAARHSKIWDEALDPRRTPYEELVRDAQRDEQDRATWQQAIDKLEKAIALLPARPEAYRELGELQLKLKHWTECADRLAAADAHTDDENATRAQLWFDLGICQSRAGRFADAEHTFARAASAAGASAETWMRLGEVRIAMGKLDEAIGALDTALEQGEPRLGSLPHYLLAAAYDRARLPGDAEQQMQIAVNADRSLATIETPQYPLLGPGEHEYLMGLAYRYGQSVPEYALLYFRRFAKLAPDSPWHRRAEEHARELAAMDLPQAVALQNSIATRPDMDAVRAALVKQMPAMRACMTKLPTTALEVIVTKDGPRTTEIVRDRPIYNRIEKAGVTVSERLELDTIPHDGIEAASRCIEALSDHSPLPTPKERDSYYKIAFIVVAP